MRAPAIVIGKGRLLLVAHEGDSTGPIIGTATRNAARATWTITVGGTVRRRRHRRAAVRTLAKLAGGALIDRTVAGSPLPNRREAIGGGVLRMGGGR